MKNKDDIEPFKKPLNNSRLDKEQRVNEPAKYLETSTNTEGTKDNQAWWQKFFAGLNEFYHAPYRQTMARAARDEEDLFMLMMFAESLGIDNPASFYTLELQPMFLENFHEWHTRMGMEKCPFDHIGCC